MKTLTAFIFLLTTTLGWSAPTHFNMQFAVKPSGVPAVVKAVQDLMSSEVGQSMPGGLHLNAIIANGTSPATHEIVFLFPSMTSLANWSTSSRGQPAMQAFQASMEEHARVLDLEGQKIGGLWAAGNAMASIIGPKTIAPGLTLGLALSWGYIAGKDAVQN